MATVLWRAHPEYPEHVKAELETRVRSFSSSFLLAPVDGELFQNADTCQERLQGWPLSQGFAIVPKGGSMKQARSRFDFRCIHYEMILWILVGLRNKLLVDVSKRC
jgi:hypothetical protein